MSDALASIPENARFLELRWLITIRWTALLAYGAILAVSIGVLGFEADRVFLALLLAVGAASNLLLVWLVRTQWQRKRANNPLGYESTSYLASLMGSAISFDVLLLAGLLYLCGGFTNPFSMMFLVQVTLAAFFLDARWTWFVFLLATAAFFGLFFFNVAVPQFEMHDHAAHMHGALSSQSGGFSLHLHGMLIAFVVIGAIISFFLTRMSREISDLRQREMQRRQLLSLATLTGGAAHELASPVATIALIVDDLVACSDLSAAQRDDVELMKREVARCESVLRKMRGEGGELQGEAPAEFSVQSILSELRDVSDRIECRASLSDDVRMFSLKGSLLSSLKALVKNGLQAGPHGKVEVQVSQREDDLTFTVRDRGCGMTVEEQQRCGEPFFTSKAPGEGMGLGVYLVKLFVSQLNGDFRLASVEGQGTEVTFTIPRRMLSL